MMDVVVPQTQEQWAFATLLFTSLAGGIGWVANHWAKGKVARDTAELTERTKVQEALTKAQERLIVAAEQREAVANARTDKMTELHTALTAVVTDQQNSIKIILDEVRRGNGNYEALLREIQLRTRT